MSPILLTMDTKNTSIDFYFTSTNKFELFLKTSTCLLKQFTHILYVVLLPPSIQVSLRSVKCHMQSTVNGSSYNEIWEQ